MIYHDDGDEEDEECGAFLYPNLIATHCYHKNNRNDNAAVHSRSRLYEAVLFLFLLTLFFSAETATQARTTSRARTIRSAEETARTTLSPSISTKLSGISNSSFEATTKGEATKNHPDENATSTATFGEQDWKDFAQDYQQRFDNRLPPDTLRPWLRYARKHQCNERDYYDAIDADLQVFRGIILEDPKQKLFRQEEIVPLGIQQTTFYMGLHLENNQWKVVASVDYHHKGQEALLAIQEQLIWIMEPLRAHTPPLNATYFFNLHDGSRNQNSTRPIFSVCKQAYWTDNVSVPSEDTVDKLLRKGLEHSNNNNSQTTAAVLLDKQHKQQHDYPPFNPHVADNHIMDAGIRDILVPFYHNLPRLGHHFFPGSPSSSPTSFPHRKDSIVWRGSTTGPWGTGPRFQLIQKFGAHATNIHVPLRQQQSLDATLTVGIEEGQPVDENDSVVQVDFGFTQVVQGKNKNLPTGIRMSHYMAYPNMQKNKYIMDVDGNSFTERFPALLQSGSLVFKSTRYKEWYTDRLVPYEDYIPVNYDQSDLVDKVAWAHRHPDLMTQITKNANKTIQEHVRMEDMRCYVYRLMLEYQTLFEP